MIGKCIGSSELELLIEKAKDSSTRRALKTIHLEEYSGPQAVLSVICSDSYVRPHKHPTSSEIWIPVQGEIYVPLFDEKGEIIENNLISRESNEGLVFYEVPQNTFHGAFALEPYAVTIHISRGPFDVKSHRINANWAVDEKDPEAENYFRNLKGKIF